MTYQEALDRGEKKLNMAGIADARNDAWLLLAMVCQIDHTFYYVHMEEQMDEELLDNYAALIRKRTERVPLQYITGEQEFMGLRFRVNSNVLIPRQDTETLVEEALKRIAPGMKVMDMCTGSGCVLISILKNCVGVEGWGYDISKQALLVAKENAKLNDVAANFERSDLYENVTEQFDMIVSNPPYIPTDDIPALMPEVSQYEPSIALDGKDDGLHFYRKIIAGCREFLKPDGMLLFEIGCEQGAAVSKMMRYAGFSDVQVIRDLAQHDRVVYGKL
jgi:release factor glutamine methyltransferase